MKPVRIIPLMLALIVGCLVNVVGDYILGVRIELFWGLDTFNIFWFAQIFILPIVVGFSVTLVYGLGGKWIAMFPPLMVRWWAYYETQHLIGVPDGAALMPLGWWGFFVILAIEVAMIGGVVGEISIKRIYGRTHMPLHVSDKLAENVTGQREEQIKS